MTDRIKLDDLTSDQLDALYDRLDALRQVARGYCPACGRGDAAPSVTDWEQQKQRADEAETRLTHLQATGEAAGRLLTRTTDERDTLAAVLREVLATFTTARRDDGVIAGHFLEGAIHPDDMNRWRAALPKEQP